MRVKKGYVMIVCACVIRSARCKSQHERRNDDNGRVNGRMNEYVDDRSIMMNE